MQYLAILETDGGAYGGYVPELHVSATGKSLQQVRERLAQGVTLALDALGDVPAQAKTLDDLSEEDREAFANSDIQMEFIEPAPMNPVSLEIERLMKAAGITQTALAQRLGTSQSAVSRMTNPFYWGHSLDVLRRVADALGAKLSVKLEVV